MFLLELMQQFLDFFIYFLQPCQWIFLYAFIFILKNTLVSAHIFNYSHSLNLKQFCNWSD